ncbi:hypothetical protein SETIT_4G108900v2 [Setaria italica]|uniref:RST domain-containing protein n=1 Tax=Setaria italica TaxID=4555 RepID=A0A368QSZ2_SETIT|nr:hypothetical protein SETIT_4G108900v2 [Setaria italica]
MELLQKYPNAVCLKRKLVDSYLTKDSKSRRVEVDNVSFKVGSGSSSDPHAHRCRNQPNLANDCVNYLNSTVLTRVVFYKEGPWCSFPEKPSLWYKSPVKIATATVNTASDSICIKAISRNVSSATLGHDSLAPSLVPVKCESIDPKIGGSAIVSVAVEYQDFPSPSLPLQNSSAHCPESCDPFVPIMVPTVQTSVPREVTENFSLRINNCNTGPSMETNGHAPITQTSVSERHNSGVSRSTVQNSESLNMKSLHSVVPSTVPRISKPLPTAIAHENSSYPDATGSDAKTSAVSPQFQSASMPHQSYAGSSAPHPHVRSMVSQLRVPSTSKMPQVQVQGTMLQNFKNIVKLSILVQKI